MTKQLAAYRFDATASVKSVTEATDGSLKIAGWGAVFDEIDREDEAFLPGAFSAGLRTFLSGNRPLCYAHRLEDVIGRVTDARVVEGVGLWVEATVAYQHPTSPLRYVYDAIRAGSVDGFSVGGYFKRKLTELGPRIFEVDLVEISVTATPVGAHATTFDVLDQKGLTVNIKGLTTRRRSADPVAIGGGTSPMAEVQTDPSTGLGALEQHARAERWAEHRRDLNKARHARREALIADGFDPPVWEPLPTDPPTWWEGPHDSTTTIHEWVTDEPDEGFLKKLNRAMITGERAPEPTRRLVSRTFSEPSPEDVFAAEAAATPAPSRPRWSDV